MSSVLAVEATRKTVAVEALEALGRIRVFCILEETVYLVYFP